MTPEEIALAETATAATESIQKQTGEEGFSLENVLTDTESEERMVEKIALRQAVDALPQATAATESIQKQTGEEGFSLENVLTDTESEERMVEKIALRQAVDALPQREKTVIQLRYFHSLTQQRVAKVMGVSQVQVSRIEKKAIGLLRQLMEVSDG